MVQRLLVKLLPLDLHAARLPERAEAAKATGRITADDYAVEHLIGDIAEDD
jgi:hypothetical protein